MTPAEIAAFQAPADHLAGRIILVTGATKGIGRALALGLGQHGATVILSGRSQKKLDKVYDELVAAGCPTPAMLPLDLENALAGHYDAVAEAIGTEFGRLDGLVHNASLLLTRSPISHYDVPTWCRLLQVNLTATFALTQVCLPLLEKSADASVVMTASSVGRRGRAYWGGLRGLQSRRREFGGGVGGRVRGQRVDSLQHPQSRCGADRHAGVGVSRGRREPTEDARGDPRRLSVAARPHLPRPLGRAV